MKQFLKRVSKSVLGAVMVMASGWAVAPAANAQMGGFEVAIQSPQAELVVPNRQKTIEVKGLARLVGGVRRLDLFLVLDTSKSLLKSDPKNHRTEAAVGLVKSLSWSDVHIGVVDFDRKTQLISPLTGDRMAVIKALRTLDQKGSSDPTAGIRMALQGFAEGGRENSTRMMLVFTDGKLKHKDIRSALVESQEQGVSISTVAFGSTPSGESILRELADGTGGIFVPVNDPSELPDAFLNLRTTGVEDIELRVNDSDPIPARMAGANFSADVPLELGENQIVVRAMSYDGREKEARVAVTVRSAGCAELTVRAERDGVPALSISNRAVEIVVDGSGSMWGRMEGRTKIEIAKQILEDALGWLPPDLNLSLRAYGHQFDRKEHNCEDTELLVTPGRDNRSEIRAAIAGLQPKGYTPLGYSLSKVASDFGDFVGERAVVLVTDGLESCDGDAPAEARALQAEGALPVHVISFGLGGKSGKEDLGSLRAIAEASRGKFLTASSAAELRRALETSVGTSYRVLRGDEEVARGNLGSDERIRLPGGDYRLELDSAPPHTLPVSLTSEENLTVVLRREEAGVLNENALAPTEYIACDENGPEAPQQEGS